MSYTVYRIHTIPSSTNAYTTGRMETWTLKLDRSFDDLDDAQDYVRNMNRAHSDLPLFLVDLKTSKEKEEFVDRFCFSEDYLHLARFFLGRPDEKKIIESIKNQGINVIRS